MSNANLTAVKKDSCENQSGRWTASEIVYAQHMDRDKVFYSADKAVLKEDIQELISLFENSKLISSDFMRKLKLLCLLKSKEDSK